jgi:hypothetical protein
MGNKTLNDMSIIHFLNSSSSQFIIAIPFDAIQVISRLYPGIPGLIILRKYKKKLSRAVSKPVIRMYMIYEITLASPFEISARTHPWPEDQRVTNLTYSCIYLGLADDTVQIQDERDDEPCGHVIARRQGGESAVSSFDLILIL